MYNAGAPVPRARPMGRGWQDRGRTHTLTHQRYTAAYTSAAWFRLHQWRNIVVRACVGSRRLVMKVVCRVRRSKDLVFDWNHRPYRHRRQPAHVALLIAMVLSRQIGWLGIC